MLRVNAHELRRQRDLPHVARRRRAERPRRGLLPLCRLQSLVRARGRPGARPNAPSAIRISSAPTAQAAARFEDARALAAAIARLWNGPDGFVVFTGGEPLLQLDAALIDALHAQGFSCAVETNGTLTPPDGLDWICVSPKADAPFVLRAGDELKLVFPQDGTRPGELRRACLRPFLPATDGRAERIANTEKAAAYCLAHPRWRLSLQTHKLIGCIPVRSRYEDHPGFFF